MSGLRIDVNADLGESFGRWTLGDDPALMKSITSANVACGYHAGDPVTMRRTVRLAVETGVAIGAHPGFPDLSGFGRRNMAVPAGEVEDMVLYQIGALAAIAAAEGARLQHVKVHGALYSMAARDPALASAIANAVRGIDSTLLIFGPPGSELVRAAADAGLQAAAEGFADRSYEPDGSLTHRDVPGAVIHDLQIVIERTVRMVRDGVVRTRAGGDIPMRVDTICTHGDTPGSAELTRHLRLELERAGVTVKAAASQRMRP